MWKRLQGHGRERDKNIGNPVLLETTYDEDQLRHIPNVSDVQQAAYYRPNTALATALSPQAYDTLKPPARGSDVPTVSSTYSQPSPVHSNFSPAPVSPSSYDVSPPSSPEPDLTLKPNQPRRYRSMRDVSPIDENRGKAASHIPVLRKAPAAIAVDKPTTKTQKFWGGKVAPNSKVKWDEYSGEPTASGAGRPGQVSPGSYAKGSLHPTSDRPMGYHVSVTGGQDRPGRGTTRPSALDTAAKPREPWSLASGRAEIVQPFKDKPLSQPWSFLRKENPKQSKGQSKDASRSPVTAVHGGAVAADTEPVAAHPEQFDTHDDSIPPTVPLKVGKSSTPKSLASPTSPFGLGIDSPYTYPSPVTPTYSEAPTPIAKDTPVSKPTLQEPFETPRQHSIPTKTVEDNQGLLAPSKDDFASRFSWTTYNTTAAQSPPPSPPSVRISKVPDEPVPEVSILNRRRPVPSSDLLPARKPVPSIASTKRAMSSGPPSPRPDSTFSTSTQKALPRPPTELTAADHIEILESQMEDLRVRRSNVYRLLRDLNNAAPPNPLVTDFKKMRLVDQRKKDFEEELAEIKREEHDVGLRLHRAWRKREKDDPSSESALWVRRVTS
ncbi:hypothetical protein BS50DRAFT_374767 [Corynespora cassiicola Philippines]|uniref:Uncharacterized protein n=1 Tax=Corynespora cassiicola Philippines TaxID=1448308 RepID=A0A2T2NN28_CORCC|nr:hypothetical protein BS50DRAFT_374767 [Corynespora cassiicola Philippines]